MDRDFAGKVAIVTGGASGMGAEAVGLLVLRGCKVAIVDLNMAGAEALASELGEAAFAVQCDVANVESVEAMVATVVARWGRLDLVFNNAGKGHLSATAALDVATWRDMIAVNLDSVFYVTKFAIPHLQAAGGGAIVNTASVDGMGGDAGMGVYNAAKGGVVNYTRSLAIELARDGIRVNAVCPGLIIDTPMTAHIASVPSRLDPWLPRIPVGRGGKGVEVAQAMVFLASDAASYITGVVIPVDGGLTCQTGFPDLREGQRLD